jgi:hypothetical protein
MASLWELPEEIQVALSAHHQVILKGEVHPLSATVAVANEVAHSFDVGVIPKADGDLEEMTEAERDCIRAHTSVDRSTKGTMKHACEGLNLDQTMLLEIRREAKEVLGTLFTSE